MDNQDIKVEVVGLGKRYASATALEPTSLKVRRGEFLTLLGPSGSGKTTLLMMIAGLTDPSEGKILIEGEDVTELPAFRRDIGVVFQNYALFPHLTVLENVAFPLRMRKQQDERVKKQAMEALALVQLGHLAQRYPRELSGGQQQRVAFARAIVFKPAVIMMDEPLGALDKKLREELKLELRNLHKELSATIIYVTHDQDEAMLLSDRICLMNHARVEQLATPDVLYQQPLSRFAAEFIGDSNVLPGRVLSVTDYRVEVLLDCGWTLHCPVSDTRYTAQQKVQVLVRPENVQLHIRDARPAAAVSATVDSVVALGSTKQIFLQSSNGQALKALVLGYGAMPVAAGMQLAVSVQDGQGVILADAGEHA